MIRFDHVTKRYPERGEALSDLSFELESGEMAFLTGRSGAGKSTLLRLVGLMERPTRGSVSVNGRDLAGIPRRQLPYYRRELGIIFQDHHLLPDRSVFDNVALPLVVTSMGRGEIGRRVRAALDQVGLLGKERCLPAALSGGEQQRVGIARAVVGRPSVIIADEPTGNLDPDLAREVMQLFRRFHQVGVTLLIATHDLGLINAMPFRTLTLHEGRLAVDSGIW